MTLKAQLLSEIDASITEGERLEASMQMTGMAGYESTLPESDFRAFATTGIATIKRIAGDQSSHYKSLNLSQMSGALYLPGYTRITVPSIIGSLKSLRGAVDGDLLVSLEDQLRDNIHKDLLQQANTLLDGKYHIAAMVIIGGVLEDRLRKLCTNRALTWKGAGNLSTYNDLLKEKAYELDDWRKIQSVGDVRNYAAHGEFAKVKKEAVEEAMTFVTRLLKDHPA